MALQGYKRLAALNRLATTCTLCALNTQSRYKTSKMQQGLCMYVHMNSNKLKDENDIRNYGYINSETWTAFCNKLFWVN